MAADYHHGGTAMTDTSSIPLIARAEGHRDRTAVVAPEGSFTYGELLDASARAASSLLGGAADLDDARVAFLAPPGIHYLATQWGIWRAGGVAVPLAVSHPGAELEYTVDDSEAAVLAAHPMYEDRLRPIAEARGLRLLLTTALLAAEERALPAVDVDRPAMILYTSGSTGRPKGVVTTHAILQAQVTTLVEAWQWTAEDRILNVLPLHHVHGIVNAMTCALWAGATCELQAGFDAASVWGRLEAGDLTLFMGVPTTYGALIEAWDAASPERRAAMSGGAAGLRLMVSGSDALPVVTLERWKAITGQVLLERYGMTEIGMALSNPLHGERRPGHVGSPLPGVEVRLVRMELDEDSGEHSHGGPAGAGSPGEIHVRGASVFREYWRRPEATREAFDGDGWFCSGDVASLEDGSYRIWGRASQDIIITGGENVSAKEVEQVIAAHPDVKACAVVGIKDPYWGKAVSAVLVTRTGAEIGREALRRWARDRLAPYKIPQRVLTLDELPVNAMGKVIKPRLVEEFDRSEHRIRVKGLKPDTR